MTLKKSAMKLKKKCKFCGGDGRTVNDPSYCKHCDTHAKEFVKAIESSPQNDYIEAIRKISFFNLKEFDNEYKHLADTEKFRNFRRTMVGIVTRVIEGDLAEYSVCLQLDNCALLDTFARAYLFTASNSGKSIYPYVDAEVLYNLYNDSNQRFMNFGFKEALTVDILCVKLIKTPKIYTIFEIVPYVVKARASLGKPTIILLDIPMGNFLGEKIMTKIASATPFRDLFTSKPLKSNPYAKVVYTTIKDK